MGLVHTVEGLLVGTPVEPLARRLYQQIHSLGHPRRRQSLRYDRDTVRIMARILQSDSSCADVGAHRGSLLEEMVRLAPRGCHLAFEPLPHLAARLRHRFPGVAVYEVALSDHDGESSFQYVVDEPGLSGLRRLPKVKAGARVEEIRVRTARLDDLVPSDAPLRFVKVDVEGAQLQVLRGAEQTIERFRPVIVFEHGYNAQETYGTTPDMLWELVTGRFGMRISLLADWLAGCPPLTREAFNASIGLHDGSEFCFLAHP
jgi:FkbM family methyltransferase